MSTTISEVKELCTAIQEETRQGSISAARLGSLLNLIADLIENNETALSGKYTKPSGGIPKTDLASAVQTSLNKADSAAQPAALSEVLLRAQGRSENYNGATDPVKYKLFGGEDYPDDPTERTNAVVYDINTWLDSQHYGSGGTVSSVPQGLIHIDQEGSCLWFINSPISYADDTWLQIAFNGKVEEMTINGVTRQYIHVSDGEDSRMWQRMCRGGIWGEWGQVTVSPADLDGINQSIQSLTDKKEVVVFDNPSGNEERVVYERIAVQMSDGRPVVPVAFFDYSDGYEIVDDNYQWYHGFAYRDTSSSIRVELYGVDEDHNDIRAWIRIVKDGKTYTKTQGYYMTTAVATTSVKGLMSAQDKDRLDTMYQYGKSKGWWN